MTKLTFPSSLPSSHPTLESEFAEKTTLRKAGEKAWSKHDEQKLRQACAEFESLFINLVMKQMRKTVPKAELMSGGRAEEIFTSMMDEELSKQVAFRQGLGLREALIEQLTGRRGPSAHHPKAIQNYTRTQSAGEKEYPFELPVSGKISSPYGWRADPISGRQEFHQGIDIASPHGAEIYAAGAGRVVFSGWIKGYGRVVEIAHRDGVHTLYAHNSKNLVREGEEVTKNQAIALVGSSGRSTGPHLHYEVRAEGEPIDPKKVTELSERRWYSREF